MDRPRVVTLSVASADGRLAVSRDRPLLWGDPRWAALPGAQEIVRQVVRDLAPQANLEGSGSFVPDDRPPSEGPTAIRVSRPHNARADFLPDAACSQAEGRGWFAVVDGRGRIRWTVKIGPDEPYVGWPLLVFVCRATPPDYLAFLRSEGIAYLGAGDERVDLSLALRRMRERLGVERVLSTAGGRLSGALLRAGLVDEVQIVYLPGLVGTHDAPHLFEAAHLGESELPTRLCLLGSRADSQGRLWARYEVVREGGRPTDHSPSRNGG